MTCSGVGILIVHVPQPFRHEPVEKKESEPIPSKHGSEAGLMGNEFFLGYTEEIQLEKNSGEERVLTRWWRVVRRLQRPRRVQRYFAYLGLYLKTKSPQILSDLKRHYPKE